MMKDYFNKWRMLKMIKDYDNWILRHFVVEKALGQEGTKALRKAIRHKGNRAIRIFKNQYWQNFTNTNFITNLVPYCLSALVPAEPVLHFRWLRSIGATHVKRWVEGRRAVAFTMAEILLSLTIIGVVAAITLPSLTGNINEKT